MPGKTAVLRIELIIYSTYGVRGCQICKSSGTLALRYNLVIESYTVGLRKAGGNTTGSRSCKTILA